MRYSMLAVSFALILAGCTSQQPANPSYSAASQPALQAVGAPGAAAGSAALPPPSGVSAVDGTAAAAAGFPPAPAQHECRTVGNVTTCDVPADPDADSTLYTN